MSSACCRHINGLDPDGRFYVLCQWQRCKNSLRMTTRRPRLWVAGKKHARFARIDFPPFPVFYRNRGKEGVDCEQSEQDGAVQYNHNHTRCSGNSQLPHHSVVPPLFRSGLSPCAALLTILLCKIYS